MALQSQKISCSSTNKIVHKVLIVWIICTIIASSSNAYITHKNQDVAVMAHVIGSGAMNLNHYFYTLGVACENRSPAFWKSIEQDRNNCMNTRESANSKTFYENLPKGSFEKMCRNWKQNEICNINFARNLNQCLDRTRGSDALEFMEAYVTFLCKCKDTETQLAVHTRRQVPIMSPGVFKCFPQLQDRILNCVKEDTIHSNSLCSQFLTVQQCFSRFYTSYRNCDNIGVVGYLRDLFRSMAYTMKCPESDGWDNNNNNPVTYPKQGGHIPSIPYQLDRFPSSAPYNLQSVEDKSRPWPRNNSRIHDPHSHYYYSRERSNIDDSFSPTPIPLWINQVQKPAQTNYYKPVPLVIRTDDLPSVQPLPPPSPQFYNERSDNDEESPLGKWFNLQQRKFSKNGPAWAWGYERYATPRQSNMDRFYSYRTEPHQQLVKVDDDVINTDLNKGVYDLYNVHYDRYGLPRSRGLSNRNPSSQNQQRRPKLIIMDKEDEESMLWDQHDNHFRKFKDDHMFQTTPRISSSMRYIHSAQLPTKMTSKKGDYQYVKKTNSEINNNYPDYKIIVITNTTPLTIPNNQENNNNRIKYPTDLLDDIVQNTLPPPKIHRNRTFQFRQNNNNNNVQFFRSVSTKSPKLHKIIVTEGASTYADEYFPESDNDPTTVRPKSFSFRPPDQQFVWRPSTTTSSSIGDNVVTTFRNNNTTRRYPYYSKNFTLPAWPRPRNNGIVTNSTRIDNNNHPSPVNFDSKRRVPIKTPIRISTTMLPRFTDLDEEEDTFFKQSTTTRPKILRKIKVRKRPTSSTTEFSTTDY